jgi:site-specific DNA recombinase
MRVAIYARRSTDEHQAASLDVQTGEARRFCEVKGWTVVGTFLEDAVSRAEFVKRPALVAMLNAADRKEFDVVVTRDESRLGGDMFRTGLLVQDLLDAGVRLFYYFTNEEVCLDGPHAKFMMAAKAYTSEIERAKIAARTREALEVKARRGVNVGGRVYGYDNLEIREGERRARVEYRINETQASIIREVFARYVAGDGVRAIVRDLNSRRVPSPHAGRRGTGSWAPSTIVDMLKNDRYRGVVTWGRRGSVYRKGTRVEIDRPAGEWTRVERADLRIVDDDAWNAAAARRAPISERSARKGRQATHLLSGIARCGVCGGPMQADRAKWGSEVQALYRCAWSKSRGPEVCTNRVRRPIDDLEAPLVSMFRDALKPAMSRALVEIRRILEADAGPTSNPVEGLEGELRRVQAEITRITNAIVTTDAAPEALTRALLDREAQARKVREQLATARVASGASTRWADIEAEAIRRLNDLRESFAHTVDVARAALREILVGPLTCTPVETPEGNRYRVSGALALGRLISTGVLKASPTAGEQNPCPISAAILPFVDGKIAA